MLMELIRKGFGSILRAKGKLFLMVISAVVFIFLLFPFNDLGDLVSSQVARLTGNKLFLQFEQLKMSLFPTPGMRFEQVYVETPTVPGVAVQELKITPSVSGLIAQKPFGSVDAKGLFKGDVQIEVKSGAKTENGLERQRVEISAQKLNLQELRELARIPVMMKGRVDLTSTALLDLTFTEQPDVDVNLSISQFELPPSNVQTPMGPLTLPDLKLSSVEIKGRLAGGKLIIENGQIGKESDELRGTITGNLGLSLNNVGGVINPVIGGYTFNIDLKAKRNFQDRAALFLSFIDSYKSALPDGAQYKFKVSAANPMMPPTIGSPH